MFVKNNELCSDTEALIKKYVYIPGDEVVITYANHEKKNLYLCGEEMGFYIVSEDRFRNIFNFKDRPVRHVALINKEDVLNIDYISDDPYYIN